MIEEYDDLDDEGDDDVAQSVICPQCQAEFDDESLSCPVCGSSLNRRTGPWADKPIWWYLFMTAIVLILLVAFLWPFAGWLFHQARN